MLVIVGNQCFDAVDMLFGNLGDVFGPKFPVAFGADLGHQFGVEDVLQVVEAHGQLGGELFGGALVARRTVAVAVLIVILTRGADPSEDDVLRLLA